MFTRALHNAWHTFPAKRQNDKFLDVQGRLLHYKMLESSKLIPPSWPGERKE